MRGVTRKEDFVALLRSSDEHRRPPPEVLVAAGQRGLVVRDLYVNSEGEERIGVQFEGRSTLHVFPHQVALSDAKFTDGESIMGDASTYRVKCGTISFENLLGLRFGNEQDEFLVTSSGPVPATPGAILVPWCEAFPQFHGDEQKSVLARNVEQRCRVVAKLQLEFHSKSASLETPEPKQKRARGN
ncbi:unnamed protein product [Symbiodinium sp. CCMP2592]|nr:unnamed protein product [Symbiodinium sp. CCMP2592]